MSFLDHLEELRWLLVRSSIFILGGGAVAFFFRDFIFNTVIFGPKDPNFITYKMFCKVAQYFNFEDGFCNQELPFEIQNRTMDGQFSVIIWTCISAGFIIAVPFILWEVWKFISPALYKNEKKYAKLFIVVSSLLFFLGVLFGYYMITPLSINFLANIQVSEIVKNQIDINSYISLVKTTSIACGLVFELPIIIYFLSVMNLVTPEFLRDYRKYAIVLILIVAAVITPPDVVSQIIVSIPLLILYEVSIYISKFVQGSNKRKELANTNITKSE
ncbi:MULTISPECIES: twin-arginine translocase subunit TatC [Myroides]|uniref:Sec-independent protein translocase protein TatC n=1 Tax=Myroides albus TaxID=2562892 RepID=A0A6I3LM34_9FLAO|nr:MULTISPECIES: twin-arginine translocase subunit TatC [Myroides]MTG98360.1 twin-arginine translocase subunit TatC [Myroides albus]MVX35711.1 twin-arginine translocase subunit TatC [Myroides sp. LoEW2-1]UVD81273.1 twin-arginine translocase subunit TatC [Myroides albus]